VSCFVVRPRAHGPGTHGGSQAEPAPRRSGAPAQGAAMTTEPTLRVPGPGVEPTPRRLLLLGAVLGYSGALWLSLFHRVAGAREPHALATLALRDGTLALPLVLAG